MGGSGSGRPGKPTGQHKLHGTYRGDRHDDRCDDTLFDGIPERPNLVGDAAKLWDAIVPSLIGAKIATEVDAAALESMCRLWALYLNMLDQVEQMEDHNNIAKSSTILARYHREFCKLACRFGLTPVDRMRFSKPKGEHVSAADKFGIMG